MSKVKLVVFDVGGTIVEDNGEVISSFCSALEAIGLVASESELRDLKGSSKRDVIKSFVERRWGKEEAGNEERIRKAYGDFKVELENRFANGGVKPIPGADATFAWLKERNILCATTTGFYRSVSDLILDAANWSDTFAVSICSDDVKAGRPAPYMIFHAMEAVRVDDVREVLNVGDTPLDIQAGSRAGVLGKIAVLSGIHTRERLLKESPSHVIASVADLPSLIETNYFSGSTADAYAQ